MIHPIVITGPCQAKRGLRVCAPSEDWKSACVPNQLLYSLFSLYEENLGEGYSYTAQWSLWSESSLGAHAQRHIFSWHGQTDNKGTADKERKWDFCAIKITMNPFEFTWSVTICYYTCNVHRAKNSRFCRGIDGQRRHRSTCANAQVDLRLRCPLTES